MKEIIGNVFSISDDNPAVPGCTISKTVYDGDNYVTYFSLAPDTDISAEIFSYHKLIFVNKGALEVYGTEGRKFGSEGKVYGNDGKAFGKEVCGTEGRASEKGGRVFGSEGKVYGNHRRASESDGYRKILHIGESILTETDTPVGMRTIEGAVYTEISVHKEDKMNKAINAGEVFQLKELVPYQEGKIVNMDVVHNDKMKFVVMAFDKGTGLSEHAAPGEALIFALDGEGVICYEGKEYPIKAGENFHFAKGGLHAVKATEKFKMALLLTLE